MLTLAWTLPVGVAIGSNPRLARWLQPLVQITAAEASITARKEIFATRTRRLPIVKWLTGMLRAAETQAVAPSGLSPLFDCLPRPSSLCQPSFAGL